MNILLINGSPKGEKSNTLKVSRAFLEGLSSKGNGEVRERHLSKLNIHPCQGCFSCWNKTPGQCIFKDDMPGVLEDMLWADVTIWSFPLYYFGVPGPLKNMIDRQLPMSLPFMEENTQGGSGSHPSRFDMSGKRHVVISTCGFYSAEKNYDGVTAMFDHFLGKGAYETIFCGQGELFRVPELASRTDQYLALAEKAGEEYAAGSIQMETKKGLGELLFPKETFEAMADASWGISRETGEKEDESLIFTRQMAALYNPASYDGKDRVLEICYTDLARTYQIALTKEGSRVVTDGALTATTRIDTPWDVWGKISRGELSGSGALAKGLYSVNGDFSLMIHWDDFFGPSAKENREGECREEKETEDISGGRKTKAPSLTLLLAPWITFWVAVSINPVIGAAIVIAECALLPLVFVTTRWTIYDKITLGVLPLLSLLAMQSGWHICALTAGYLGFGLLWLLSSFTKEPLCAAYVKYSYGGDNALENPIFVDTNRILAAGWGILYILIAAESYFMLRLHMEGLMQGINNGATVLMGIFTGWFQNWYPAYVASGKRKAKH